MKKLYFSIACLALIGCGDGNIDIVKNTTLPQNKTMTIGDAIDNFQDCKSVKWEDTSKYGQKIVTATCTIKSEVLKNEFEERQREFNSKKQKNEEMINKEYDTLKKNLQNRCKNDEEILGAKEFLELTKKHCELTKRTKGIAYSFLKCDKSIIEELKSIDCMSKYSVYNMENLLKPIAYYDAVGLDILLELPIEVKSRAYKISFYVNTDKTVDLKDSYVINDDEQFRIYDDKMLREFYRR